MKTIILSLVGAVVIGGIIFLAPASITEFEAVEREKEVVEVAPEWSTDEDAVKAAKDVIRKKELRAEKAELETEVKEREARLREIEKELGF